jgi:NAD dependent epimerase/dehydratase family enzyme
MSHSNLKSLTVYPLNNQQLVITRSVNTASAATALTIHYTSPTRLITASAITFYLPKGMITISSKPSTCAALLP